MAVRALTAYLTKKETLAAGTTTVEGWRINAMTVLKPKK
jgi:hypothetical protein